MTLDIRREDGVLTLVLDRPDKRNALSQALIARVREALDTAADDAGVRCVVLRGAGPDFCAGADLAELLASADQSPEENAEEARRLGDVFERLRRQPQPVVAAVHGRALAGGLGLATACDVVLATRSARLGYPEVARGFVPAMVMAMLRRQMGELRAFDLVATGRVIGANEAQALGLVTHVYDDAEFDAAVQAYVAGLLAASATALRMTKRLFHALDGISFAEGISMGARVNGEARATDDFRRTVARFLER